MWWAGFLKRHKDLKFSRPGKIGNKAVEAFNPTTIKEYFDELGRINAINRVIWVQFTFKYNYAH